MCWCNPAVRTPWCSNCMPNDMKTGKAKPLPDTFNECLAFALLPDNDGQPYHVTPGDPGRGTAWGVTQATYTAYCHAHGLPLKSVSQITPGEREGVYRAYYTPNLPAGVDLMVFDFAVTAGPHRSAEIFAGCPAKDSAGLIKELGEAQAAFYHSLSTFHLFGHGWINRTNRRIAAAWKMAGL